MRQLWLSFRVVSSAAPENPAPEGEASHRARRASWLRLAAFSALALASLLGMTFASRRLPAHKVAHFDPRPAQRLERAHPDYVLLGNSMVGTRFDEATLRRLLKPHGVTVMGVNGAKSAVWYLTLENVIVRSGVHPRLIQFFRETELTEPLTFATSQRGREMIEELSPGPEPVVAQKLSPPVSHPIARLAWLRARVAPFELIHEETEPMLDSVAERVSLWFWRDGSPAERKRDLNELFSLANLRSANVTRETTVPDATPAFDSVLEPSFLPEFCALARNNGVPLTFVRVRTRAAAVGIPKTPSEQRYDADLDRYLTGPCHAELVDLHDAEWESIDLYGNGDHIAERFKRKYSALFVEHEQAIFH